MNHIKDNWTESDVFRASDLNALAGLVNELMDKQQSVINDSQHGNSTTYSSNKSIEAIAESQFGVINDEQEGVDSTYSSDKVEEEIENASFKAAIVDELPEEGEENTMYFTPAEDKVNHKFRMPMITYNSGDGIVKIDTRYLFGYREYVDIEQLSGISIGDVIKYKKPDTTSQKCMSTYDGGDTWCYVSTGDTLFAGNYNIGDTFEVTSPSNDDVLITSYNDIGLNYDYLRGITGKFLVEAGKVYRMTGFEQMPNESISDSDFREFYSVFVATFEEAVGETSATHTVERLGSIFVKNKPSTKQYSIFSEINKDEIIGSVSVNLDEASDEEIILSVVSGISSTITLQDGHYYRLKDRYALKGKNTTGNYMSMCALEGTGAEALIYEEVTNPSTVKYEDIEFVPGALVFMPCLYGTKISAGCVGFATGGLYYVYWQYPLHDVPSGLKIGDVLKITGNNPIIPIGINESCVTSAETKITIATSDHEYVLKGIISNQEWAKNERYRLIGLNKINNISKLFGELPVGVNVKIEGFVPIFEKISNTENYDYEVNGLPGMILSILGKSQAKDKWMWVNGDWEFISGPEPDAEEEDEDDGNGE